METHIIPWINNKTPPVVISNDIMKSIFFKKTYHGYPAVANTHTHTPQHRSKQGGFLRKRHFQFTNRVGEGDFRSCWDAFVPRKYLLKWFLLVKAWWVEMLGIPPKQKRKDHLGIYAATLTISQAPRKSTYYTTCIPSMSKPSMDNYPRNPRHQWTIPHC